MLEYVVPRHRRGLLLGTISIARCLLSVRVQRSPALILRCGRVPEGKFVRCILTCGSAPGSRVKSAWPHLRPNAHDWSRSARLLSADGYNESCLVMQDIEGNEFCLD